MSRIKFLITKLLFAAVCLFPALSADATNDPEIFTVFKGDMGEIVIAPPGGTTYRETIDDIYYDPSRFPTIANPNSDKITNAISLFINEALIYKIKTDFTAWVKIKIEYTLLDGSTTGSIAEQLLEINYSIAGGLKYNARQTIKFDKCRRVKVTILDISSNTYGWDIWEVLNLENRMLRKRDYVFDNNTFTTKIPPAHTTPSSNADELLISWSSDPLVANGKTHIDIEWTWIDAEAIDNYKKPDPADNNTLKLNADLIFKNNSSRVTIESKNHNSYSVPLIYDGSGQLFYRIRPVQYKEDGQVVNGIWSADAFADITSYTQTGVGHEGRLNWQTTTSFAEEGKRKTVVQYFDGTLRGRQTVTKDNVSNKTVVAESFYDYQGRPAINILPAPTMSSLIKFTEDFNKFNATYVTPKDVFDVMPLNVDACSFLTPALINTNGASKYYSPGNDEKTLGLNQFIPDAAGYPYVETRYTPDATGRIEAQGGVGEIFQLGRGNDENSHDTKYYYGKPDQKELDALFGTEAGNATHYSKNMVRDANGQYSVSYVDMHGRVVATALAGEKPANLQALDSYAPGTHADFERDLLSSVSNRVEGRSIVSTTSLIVTNSGNHKFHYKLDAAALKVEIEECKPPQATICYDCYYDLEIRISGSCIQTIVETATNLSFINGALDLTCDPQDIEINEFDFTHYLPAGEYNITKTLTVSKTAQDWYLENVFNQHNICKTLEEFYNNLYTVMIGQSSCDITCVECTIALGTETDYRKSFLLDLGYTLAQVNDPNFTVPFEAEIKQSWLKGKINCDDICSADKKNTLGSIKDAMIEDMIPGQGQYARLDVDLDGNGTVDNSYNTNFGAYEKNTNRPFNIFNPRSSIKPPLGRTITPYKEPYDENNNAFYADELGLEDPDGVIAIGKTPEEFSDDFKQTWGKALLKYHPEYCKLQLVETTPSLKNSYTWDTQLENVNTWAAAVAAGYTGNEGNNLVDNDPFFSGVGAASYKNLMKQYIHTNFNRAEVTVGTDVRTLWKLAWMSVFCIDFNNPLSTCGENAPIKPSLFGNPNTCTGDWNYVWRIFRTLYLSEKDRMINLWLEQQCPFIYSTIDSDPTHYIRRFGKPEDYYGNNYMQTILDKVKLNNGAQSYVNEKLQEQYADNCESYKPVWIKQLRGCDQVANNNVAGSSSHYTFIDEDGYYIFNQLIEDIIVKLKAICIEGSDENHPMGSSNVLPGSTYTPTSFQQVLSEAGINTSAICHLDLVDFPPPFDKQAPLSDITVLLQKYPCICNRLAELNAEKNADIYFPGGNMHDYLLYRHQIDVPQSVIDVLTNGCNAVPGCITYDPAMIVPAIFSCQTPIKNCISCNEYNAFKTEFINTYPAWGGSVIYPDPQTDDQLNANKAFAKFMNNKTGFVKTWFEYLEFENVCSQEQMGDSVSNVSIPGCIPSFQKYFGGNGDDKAYSSVTNPDGSIVFAGFTNSFGHGGYDGYLQKMDNAGNILWSKAIGGTGNDYLYSIKKTTDGGYIAVGASSSYQSGYEEVGTPNTAWMIKTDANGNLLWDKKYSDGNSYGSIAMDVTVTSDGGYAIAGSNRHAAGTGNAMVIKTDNSGHVLWTKSFDSQDTDQATSIAVDGGGLIVGGMQHGQTTTLYDAVLMKLNESTGNVIWSKNFDVNAEMNWFSKLTVTTAGYNFSLYNDNTMSYPPVSPDHYVCRTDKSGNQFSFLQISVPVNNLIGVHAQTSDGGMIVAQYEATNINGDIYLIKLDAQANVSWSKLLGGTGLQAVADVIQANDGGYILTGRYNSTPGTSSNTKAYIVKTDAQGNATGCTTPSTTAYIGLGALIGDLNFTWNTITTISLSETSIATALNVIPAVTTLCVNSCTVIEYGPFLCGLGNMFPVVEVEESCIKDVQDVAMNKAREQYNAYLEEQKDLFENTYLNKCLEAKNYETFTVKADVSEYHYTLYYYDQAGNLVKTVPPVGVQPNFDPIFLGQVKDARALGNDFPIDHNLLTQYRYNALNQVTAQISPDGGISHFWYDILGRLVVSQNEKQAAHDKYSYTLYDPLGRIIEVGEKNKASGHDPMTQTISQDIIILSDWLAASPSEPNKNITKTVYDEKYGPICTDNYLCQQNLRSRVSFTYVLAMDDGNLPPLDEAPWENASFYTYDIHGNVDVLLQDYKTGMGALAGGNRFKKIEYKYDLVSGKVNEVAYQPGDADAFYHRYEYDAENKLTETWTSKEYVYWEREALYKYYRHGPLARTVLGQLEVQGVDYAYTLQGWLKGVNSTAQQNGGTIGNGEDCGPNSAVDNLNVYTRQSPFPPTYVARNSINFLPSAFASNMPDNFEAYIDPNLAGCGGDGTAGDEINSPFNNALFDMGQDGKTDANGDPVITMFPDACGNNIRTTDAYGYSLNYFNGDYNRISQAAANPFAVLNMSLATGDAGTPNTAYQLFNGNIGAMLVSIPKLGSAKVYGYNYDQLNRITNMFAFKGVNTATNTFTPIAINDYKEKITYDANGNILTYKRNGVTGVVAGGPGGLNMDDLAYDYIPNSNKLKRVTDNPANSGNYPDDIDDQVDADNYVYDEIGNLIIDKAEKLYDPTDPTKPMIEWNVYGKISRITKKGDPFDQVIEYKYDASGNRIQKIVYPPDRSPFTKITHYVRDASGNVMSVYTSGDATINDGELTQTELHLYGSSRLGVYNVKTNVQTESRIFISMDGVTEDKAELFTFTRANKFFELSNHLGNVLVTVTDKKVAIFTDVTNTTLAYYKADIATANDYYPFGMGMPARKFNAGTEYRYGFNGKEKSDEVYGEGNAYDFGARMYDPRIGKWFSVDPMREVYTSLSPYSYSANNPINILDAEGNVLIDKQGNIIATSTGKIQMDEKRVSATKSKSGIITVQTAIMKYEKIIIYADDGTPINALRLIEAHLVIQKLDSKGNLLSIKKESLSSHGFEAVSDCHGYTFAKGKLWINDDEVNKLLYHDGYTRNTTESKADAVIFKKGGAVVHSAVRNKDGTYSNDAGILTLEKNVPLDKASRGLTDMSNSNNVEFVDKKGTDKVVDIQSGIVSAGVRYVTEADVKKSLPPISSSSSSTSAAASSATKYEYKIPSMTAVANGTYLPPLKDKYLKKH
jgi:RHS repeat-associated protein